MSSTDTSKPELITSRQVISIPQRFATGPAMGRFLIELRDNKRIMAYRIKANGRYLLPPREMDAWSRTDEGEWVEVGPEGTLKEFDVVFYASPDPLTGETREVPYVVGWVNLDGTEGDSPLWHLVKTDDPENIQSGVRVRAVFAEERKGGIDDIKYFEVI